MIPVSFLISRYYTEAKSHFLLLGDIYWDLLLGDLGDIDWDAGNLRKILAVIMDTIFFNASVILKI